MILEGDDHTRARDRSKSTKRSLKPRIKLKTREPINYGLENAKTRSYLIVDRNGAYNRLRLPLEAIISSKSEQTSGDLDEIELGVFEFRFRGEEGRGNFRNEEENEWNRRGDGLSKGKEGKGANGLMGF